MADNDCKPRLFRPWILYQSNPTDQPSLSSSTTTVFPCPRSLALAAAALSRPPPINPSLQLNSLHRHHNDLLPDNLPFFGPCLSGTSSLFPPRETLPPSSDVHNPSNPEQRLKLQQRKQRPKKFRCPHCQVSFSNNGQLKGHVRIHTGERPFKCDHAECGKTFTRNEELTRHKRIHSGLRPFPCPACGKRFGRKDHLKKHLKTHQRPPPPLPLPGIALYSYYVQGLKDTTYPLTLW